MSHPTLLRPAAALLVAAALTLVPAAPAAARPAVAAPAPLPWLQLLFAGLPLPGLGPAAWLAGKNGSELDPNGPPAPSVVPEPGARNGPTWGPNGATSAAAGGELGLLGPWAGGSRRVRSPRAPTRGTAPDLGAKNGPAWEPDG
jgi:hypothetical protein